MNVSDLFAIMQGRRSIRRYTAQPIPEQVLRRLLEAAVWAPSAHNRQPWRFAVITTDARKSALAHAMGDRFRKDLLADGVPVEQVEAQVGRSYARISQAPALIVVCMSMADMDRYPDRRRQDAEWVMATQSVALAVQNLLLAAHVQGLGSCWMCAPLFVPDVVRGVLALPDDWEPQALLTLGFPARQRTSQRDPVETKSVWY